MKLIFIVLLLVLLYHLITKPAMIHKFIMDNVKVNDITAGKWYAVIFLANTLLLLYLVT
jgi:hypothetical protein